MANVLVVIELHQGHVKPVSLEALGQARRLSTTLGGTLYAVVPVERAPRYGEGDMIEVLARHGADKVVLVTDETVADGAPMRWGTHGPAIAQAAELLPPLLLVFGLTTGAREVAPRAAARLGAAYVPDAWLEAQEDKLKLWQGSGAEARSFTDELDFPIVATVPPGRYLPAAGDDEAEVEVVLGTPRAPDFEELGWEADSAPRAKVLVPRTPTTFDGGWESGPVPTALEPAALALAKALGGAAVGPEPEPEARLIVSLGPPLESARAEVKVAIGAHAAAEAAHYALVGDAAKGAQELATALASAPVPSASPPPEAAAGAQK